jgi:Zn-dependent M28 family amino/carboxypeptidase
MTSRWIVRRVIVLTIVASTVAFGAADMASGDMASGDSPTDAIAQDDLLVHLQEFQAIADAHGGNRAFDTTGYDASVDYVVARLQAAGFQPEVEVVEIPNQPVKVGAAVLARTAPTAATYVEGTDYVQAEPAPPNSVEDALFVAGGDGCDEADYAGIVEGQIALITLGGACTPIEAHLAAFTAGASGMLFAPAAGAGAPPTAVDLKLQNVHLSTPAMSVSGDVAAALTALTTTGTVTIRIETGYGTGTIATRHVLAEIEGRSDQVVMVGGHLDSVPDGAGMDDNASGAAGVLAVAEHVAASGRQPERTIRFAWWGAEEVGSLGTTVPPGSKAYVDALDPSERARIVAYLNVDMLGAPNWVRVVMDPAVATDSGTVAPGSDVVTRRFDGYFSALGEPVVHGWWNGRSDDGAFAQAGIPTGGLASATGVAPKTDAEAALFGGTAGAPTDPCYHLPCDTLANVNLDIAADLTRALGAVAWELADEGALAAPAPVPVAPKFTG